LSFARICPITDAAGPVLTFCTVSRRANSGFLAHERETWSGAGVCCGDTSVANGAVPTTVAMNTNAVQPIL